MAVVTKLSIPPLASTTAKDLSFVLCPLSVVSCTPFIALRSLLQVLSRPFGCSLSTSDFLFLISNAPRLRIPDELVELEAQAHLLAVAQNPFRKLARLEPAEDGRENDFFHVVAEPLLLKEVARVKVVRLVQNDEFDLVLAFERLEVSETESVALPAPGHLTSTIFTTACGSSPTKRSPLVSMRTRKPASSRRAVSGTTSFFWSSGSPPVNSASFPPMPRTRSKTASGGICRPA